MIRRKKCTINKILIIISIIGSIFAMAIILLPFINNASVNTQIKSSNDMQVNYTATESNTWDISENGDESVTATLDENGLLTISGTGNMKNWNSSSSVIWGSERQEIKKVEIQEGVTCIGQYAFDQCGSLTEITIPSSVTRIESNAFSNCASLINIEIPEGVTTIGLYVFSGCSSLKEITIPSSITSIGKSTFFACISLDSIKVDENNTAYYVKNEVLYTKDNTKIIKYPVGKQDSTYTILEEVTSIEDGAFYACSNLTNIIIPEGITSIGDSAFYGCSNLTEIIIPEGIRSIGNSTFERCSRLTEIIIPESITSIGNQAFSECSSLTDIIIPEGVISIGAYVFINCRSLTEVTIPSSLTSIGMGAFGNCTSLKQITLSKELTNIGLGAFTGCSNLENISVDSNNTKYCDVDGVLYTNDKTEIIKYPEGKKDTVYTILDGVTIIGNSSFNKGCSYLKQIIIPKSVTTIGNGLFKGNDQLTILCYKNSATEQYAKENNLKYLLLDGLFSTEHTIDEEKQIIKGINPNTTIAEIKTSIQSGVAYEILDKEGNVVEDTSIIGTGYVIKLNDDLIYTLIVMGDLNGDGKIGIAELARTSRLGISQEGASEIEIIAIDINMDGNIKVNDIAAISRMARE